jgi:hypothetical protein
MGDPRGTASTPPSGGLPGPPVDRGCASGAILGGAFGRGGRPAAGDPRRLPGVPVLAGRGRGLAGGVAAPLRGFRGEEPCRQGDRARGPRPAGGSSWPGLSVPPRGSSNVPLARDASPDLIPVAPLVGACSPSRSSPTPPRASPPRRAALGLGVAVVLAGASERRSSWWCSERRSQAAWCDCQRGDPLHAEPPRERSAGHGAVTGRVQWGVGVSRGGPGTGVVGAGGHVDRQRAVPDLAGGVAADAGDVEPLQVGSCARRRRSSWRPSPRRAGRRSGCRRPDE